VRFQHTVVGDAEILAVPQQTLGELPRRTAQHARQLQQLLVRQAGRRAGDCQVELGAVGGNRAAGASFASYLLFEAEFANELIELGFRDTLAQRERLAEWIRTALTDDKAVGAGSASVGVEAPRAGR